MFDDSLDFLKSMKQECKKRKIAFRAITIKALKKNHGRKAI